MLGVDKKNIKKGAKRRILLDTKKNYILAKLQESKVI